MPSSYPRMQQALLCTAWQQVWMLECRPCSAPTHQRFCLICIHVACLGKLRPCCIATAGNRVVQLPHLLRRQHLILHRGTCCH